MGLLVVSKAVIVAAWLDFSIGVVFVWWLDVSRILVVFVGLFVVFVWRLAGFYEDGVFCGACGVCEPQLLPKFVGAVVVVWLSDDGGSKRMDRRREFEEVFVVVLMEVI